MAIKDKHSIHSTLRENIIEHLFAGEILRSLWQKEIVDAEILKSEFDAGGYDLVLTCRHVTRHIQLKVSIENGARAEVGVNLRLAEKPSGCVIWIVVDDALNFREFRWFGDVPGQPLPDVSEMNVVKHTKGNAQGVKAERSGHRSIKRNKFTSLKNFDNLLHHLLGNEIFQQESV
ncbi:MULTISPECIES: hypothetical protein [unclassified Rhizobium]|uniref:hypothetical protein n=1 Tax=unclassified Rhizobium TaxID=2613769 RepID=UPI0011603BF5|nr:MULTISPECIES: hypothetical protein [unclassified Rhizobium]MBZ5759973.1 hypothetical protein [Rhizobium sp. VS19-DR96]MBZ5766546.1 hypothetical protein [Rhizobium sp. VS19-DR129.2]MBZ5774111.1 hypothetical protein [Rhizobium sp. VS19-DRK62.2]MBZ5785183.1 hypothetical protein [Rhizobium sp. VS19-DR121]MBZ5802782.1 hypothetical protein [Rhizobium sp. VS19-DR181]